MTINEAFSSTSTYGITYASLDESGLRFESEAAINLNAASVVILRMPTRQDGNLDIHEVVCMQNGWCLVA